MCPIRSCVILIAVGTAALASCSVRTEAADITWLAGHTAAVRDVGVSPDGKWLASVADDARIIMRPTRDLVASHIVNPREGGLFSLAFTHDGESVLAAGNLADFSRNSAIDGAIRVALEEPHAEDFIEFPVRGSIRQLTLVDDDTHVMYFCGGSSLLKLKIGAQEFSRETRLFGGFIGDTASSPAGRYLASTSQNEVNNRSAEPCQLTVFTPQGREVLKWQFKSERDYHGAQVCFPADDRLALCLPTGQLLKWRLSDDQKQWVSDGEPLPTISGMFTAGEAQNADGPVWMAFDQSVLAIDTMSGAERQRIDLAVGKHAGEISADPIECLTFLAEPPRIVAGLWDGRLAIVTIEADAH